MVNTEEIALRYNQAAIDLKAECCLLEKIEIRVHYHTFRRQDKNDDFFELQEKVSNAKYRFTPKPCFCQ